MKSQFNQLIEKLRSDNPETYENSYGELQNYTATHFNELIELMKVETDPSMRSKFIELIGDSNKKESIQVLAEELKSKHRIVRSWAWNYLNNHLEYEQAKKVAQVYKQENPNEDFYN